MKVLVIGSGAREHALCWKLAQSKDVTNVYVIPGNEGMADVATPVPVSTEDDIVDFARLMEIDLTVAGPETVLAEGLADRFQKEGLPFFGPSKAAARIEGSKSFAKDLMHRYGIPTAAYAVFTDEEKALAYAEEQRYPLVIKADGLAAGKGVVIAETWKEASTAIRSMMDGRAFGNAGRSVVIEEFMKGEEASVLAFCDGKTIVPMISSQDHKRIGDNDEGPNTGGMGAYSPAPVVTEHVLDLVREKILEPTCKALAEEGHPFVGCLYAGLMITDEGPKVVEFNCRFGDPETEVVLPLLASDLVDVMLRCVRGELTEDAVKWNKGYAVDVVLASEGYPLSHMDGDVISGIDEAESTGCILFHAGTKKEDGRFVTNGGRVLNVVALGDTLEEARDRAYKGVSCIRWRGMQYRRDIAAKGLAHLKK